MPNSPHVSPEYTDGKKSYEVLFVLVAKRKSHIFFLEILVLTRVIRCAYHSPDCKL